MIKYKDIEGIKEHTKIWITSDTHGFHKNICKGVSGWDARDTRNFKDEFEMTDVLVETFNKYVKKDDVLFHLGDWSFGGQNRIKEFRDRLNCKTIYLVFGNHDHTIRDNKLDTQSLFKECADVMYVQIKGNKFFLSHYAHYVWHQSHKGVGHLYGHSHSSIEHLTQGKMMDVGVDNAFKLTREYRPFSLEEINQIMQEKETNFVDHHTETTN